MLFGDVDAIEEESGLPPGHAADDVAVHRLRPNGLNVSGCRQQCDA